MDMISFKEEVLRLIAFRQEGEYWDFKKEWHKNKSDLLHDIICMANIRRLTKRFVIIGFAVIDLLFKGHIFSPTTVEAVLGSMVKSGAIKRIGLARSTRYIKA